MWVCVSVCVEGVCTRVWRVEGVCTPCACCLCVCGGYARVLGGYVCVCVCGVHVVCVCV